MANIDGSYTSIQLAADMLAEGRGDPRKLNDDLCKLLRDTDDLCSELAGELVSRQVIALAIEIWKLLHPDYEPYVGG